MSEQEERDPEQAIQEIRDKREGGDDDLSEEEREFLESERVQLDPGEGTGTPVA